MLKKITVGLVLIFWPLSLFLANTFPNFLNYLFPIFQPKFAILPLLFLILNFKKRYMKLVILSLIFIIIALFNITSLKHRKIVLTFLIAAIINLSILSSFDRNDFILYFPLSILIIHGINVFNKKYPKSMKIFYLMFIVFSSFELIRIFVK